MQILLQVLLANIARRSKNAHMEKGQKRTSPMLEL